MNKVEENLQKRERLLVGVAVNLYKAKKDLEAAIDNGKPRSLLTDEAENWLGKVNILKDRVKILECNLETATAAYINNWDLEKGLSLNKI